MHFPDVNGFEHASINCSQHYSNPSGHFNSYHNRVTSFLLAQFLDPCAIGLSSEIVLGQGGSALCQVKPGFTQSRASYATLKELYEITPVT